MIFSFTLAGLTIWLIARSTACLSSSVLHRKLNRYDIDTWTVCALKGHSGTDWPIFFSRSIKSLIYHIFTYKVWTLNFYRKGPEIWSFILTLGNSKLCLLVSPFARWRLRLFTLSTWRRMLVLQRALIRIIIRRGKVFSFSNGFWTVRTAICYNI